MLWGNIIISGFDINLCIIHRFDPEQEPGHRIVEGSVFVLNEQLDLQTKYK